METLGTKNVQPNPVNPLVWGSACCADGWSCFPQNKPHANPAASDQHDTALKHRLVPHLTRLFLASLFRAAHSHSYDGRLPPSMSRPEQAASGLETPHPLTETSSLRQQQHKRIPVLPTLWSGKNRDKSRLFTRNDKAFSYLLGNGPHRRSGRAGGTVARLWASTAFIQHRSCRRNCSRTHACPQWTLATAAVNRLTFQTVWWIHAAIYYTLVTAFVQDQLCVIFTLRGDKPLLQDLVLVFF